MQPLVDYDGLGNDGKPNTERAAGYTGRVGRGAIALAVTVLAAACTSLPSTNALLAGPTHQEQKPLEKEGVAEPRESDCMLDTGIVLRPHEGVGWGANLMLPVSIGWTDFDRTSGISLDGLATIGQWLSPFMPDTAERLRAMFEPGKAIERGDPLFPRLQ